MKCMVCQEGLAQGEAVLPVSEVTAGRVIDMPARPAGYVHPGCVGRKWSSSDPEGERNE